MAGLTADINPYEVLEVERSASNKEVRRAYRLKALKCHPDKNPDDPLAAKTFLQLTKALEILLNDSARAAFDQLLRAKDAANLRHQKLDDKRKKFKSDLEAKEQAANLISDEEKLKREIERLCKEGSQWIQEETNRLNEEIAREILKTNQRDVKACQLKVQWATQPENNANKYTEEVIRRIFSKYGSIVALAVSDKKAIVEFEDPNAAELAIKIEIGYPCNKLSIDYASNKYKKSQSNSTTSERDRESLSSRAQRQAEERRRLIEQLAKESEND